MSATGPATEPAPGPAHWSSPGADGSAARIAGAPISWGVCEVPGWGHQLSAERVLGEMAREGLRATETGPEGFLPPDPAERSAVLRRHGLQLVGGFVPVVLHEPAHDPWPAVEAALEGLLGSGGRVVVLAAATGLAGYDERPSLDAGAWRTLLAQLDRLCGLVAERGGLGVLHPHVGTLVERREEVERVLEGSRAPLCLDTGHLLVGGTDPVRLAREAGDRVAHVHAKDVDAGLAARVGTGGLTYTEAVRAGMYRPLGAGDVDVAAVAAALHGHGYAGWWVLEQDAVLAEEPVGEGPVGDVRRSAAHLRAVLEDLPAA